MTKVRTLFGFAIVSIGAALSGCVSYGNTHALITPVGAVGYHTFRPEHTNAPRELPRTPDHIAAANESTQTQE